MTRLPGRPPGIPSRVAIGGGLGAVGLIVAVLFNVLTGGKSGSFDINSSLDQFPAQAEQGSPLPRAAAQEADRKNIELIVNHVQKTWTGIFARSGKQYRPAQLVLYTDTVSTGCGPASSAVGPFYCPQDHLVYLDLGFFKELQTKFAAPGDFAQAYVIAHEFGHHVQSLLGIEPQVRRQQQAHSDKANEYPVRLELQADCFAGVWGHARTPGSNST